MDDRQALMAAVLAEPDEDTPRLALADWLQEHGDDHDRARADHIRLQIEASKLPDNSPERVKLEQQFVVVQKAHGEAWLGPLAKYAKPDLSRNDVFLGGILWWWYTPTKSFLLKPHQMAVCEWFPRVGVYLLVLNDKATREPEVATSPALAWVSQFQWSHSKLDDSGLAALAKSSHVGRLTSFALQQCKVTDAGLKAFAETTAMPNLRHFGLSSTLRLAKYTSAGVLAVLNSSRFPKLCDLELESEQTTTLDYKGLFANPGVKKLIRLRLGWKSEPGCAFRCPHLTNLRRMSVNSGVVTDADVDALLANPALAGLKDLWMYGMNGGKPHLSAATEKRLRERFGEHVIRYSAA